MNLYRVSLRIDTPFYDSERLFTKEVYGDSERIAKENYLNGKLFSNESSTERMFIKILEFYNTRQNLFSRQRIRRKFTTRRIN